MTAVDDSVWWRSPSEMQRWELVAAASRRAIVQTDDGIVGRLVCWDSGGSRGRCRVEFRPGSGRTFPLARIAWVWCDPARPDGV